MNVSYCVHAPLHGGPAHGQFALEVVTDPAASFYEPKQLARDLEQWAVENAMKTPAVHLDLYGDMPDPEPMWEFTSVVKQKGFFLRVTCDGQEQPPWFRNVDYLVAQIGNEDWWEMTCQEIRYLPPDNNLSEPRVGTNNTNTIKLVEATKKIPGDVLLSFIRDASHTWGIIVPPLRQYQLVLYQEDQK